MNFRLGFERRVALRFLREGRMQSTLILAGVTGGVAVIIFLTQLINTRATSTSTGSFKNSSESFLISVENVAENIKF